MSTRKLMVGRILQAIWYLVVKNVIRQKGAVIGYLG